MHKGMFVWSVLIKIKKTYFCLIITVFPFRYDYKALSFILQHSLKITSQTSI